MFPESFPHMPPRPTSLKQELRSHTKPIWQGLDLSHSLSSKYQELEIFANDEFLLLYVSIPSFAIVGIFDAILIATRIA
jgi:hypothetical protein